jgi:hypothetical protein
MSLAWQHPFTCTVGGATGCGKTVFVTRFLQNLDVLIDTKIEEIIWCYGVSQQAHKDMQKKIKTPIRFIEGLPDIDDISSLTSGPKIVVLDDLMTQSSKESVDLMVRASHHRSLSVWSLVQNIFNQGKGQRDMSLNSHYIVVFKNARDQAQISHFARQVDPENSKFVVEAYRDATSRPHGYLLFDFKQSTPDYMRLRTNIFPDEQQIIYVSKTAWKDPHNKKELMALMGDK